MMQLKCNPLEVRRTRIAGKSDAIEWRCGQCGFGDTDTHGHFPSKIHRTCDVQYPPPLTEFGQRLDAMSAGDGVAYLASKTGLKRLAKEWERVSKLPCGCVDRQVWLNQRWRQFVWGNFRADGPTLLGRIAALIPAMSAETKGTAPVRP